MSPPETRTSDLRPALGGERLERALHDAEGLLVARGGPRVDLGRAGDCTSLAPAPTCSAWRSAGSPGGRVLEDLPGGRGSAASPTSVTIGSRSLVDAHRLVVGHPVPHRLAHDAAAGGGRAPGRSASRPSGMRAVQRVPSAVPDEGDAVAVGRRPSRGSRRPPRARARPRRGRGAARRTRSRSGSRGSRPGSRGSRTRAARRPAPRPPPAGGAGAAPAGAPPRRPRSPAGRRPPSP